jgi:hypothetical protein
VLTGNCHALSGNGAGLPQLVEGVVFCGGVAAPVIEAIPRKRKDRMIRRRIAGKSPSIKVEIAKAQF